MKFGVADYGMNVWDGGLYDIEQRLIDLKRLGFDGTERLEAVCASDAVQKAALYRKLGMDFCTCRSPNMQANIQWTAGFGKAYIWIVPGQKNREVEYDVFCRRAQILVENCERWGLTGAIHNHMYQRIESQKELEDFLALIPSCGLILDTGHLSMAGGDPVAIVRKYHKRISALHLKDVFLTGNVKPDGIKEYQFCELGAGNNGLDNTAVLEALLDVGWDGWIHIEHDTHKRDPLIDLKTSIDFIKNIIG